MIFNGSLHHSQGNFTPRTANLEKSENYSFSSFRSPSPELTICLPYFSASSLIFFFSSSVNMYFLSSSIAYSLKSEGQFSRTQLEQTLSLTHELFQTVISKVPYTIEAELSCFFFEVLVVVVEFLGSKAGTACRDRKAYSAECLGDL